MRGTLEGQVEISINITEKKMVSSAALENGNLSRLESLEYQG